MRGGRWRGLNVTSRVAGNRASGVDRLTPLHFHSHYTNSLICSPHRYTMIRPQKRRRLSASGREQQGYNKPVPEAPRDTHHPSERFQALRLACNGELAIGAPQYKAFSVTLDHRVFKHGDFCPVSYLVGMPLLLSRARPSLEYSADRDRFGVKPDKRHFRNEVAQSLMFSCDLRDRAPFEPLRDWANPGIVTIFRADGRPLYQHHVEVLLGFLHEVFQRNRDVAMLEGVEYTPDVALEFLTPGDFRDFYMREKEFWIARNGGLLDRAKLLLLPDPFEDSPTDSQRSRKAT